MKQETLEETDKWSLEKAEEFALERFKSDHEKGRVTWDSILEVLKVGIKTGHKFGTKYQAERMYSEEEPDYDKIKEVIKTYCKNKYGEGYYPDVEKAIEFGAKWQAERMYSEEDMKKCWEQAQESLEDKINTDIGEQPKRTQPDFEEWFKQFKKK